MRSHTQRYVSFVTPNQAAEITIIWWVRKGQLGTPEGWTCDDSHRLCSSSLKHVGLSRWTLSKWICCPGTCVIFFLVPMFYKRRLNSTGVCCPISGEETFYLRSGDEMKSFDQNSFSQTTACNPRENQDFNLQGVLLGLLALVLVICTELNASHHRGRGICMQRSFLSPKLHPHLCHCGLNSKEHEASKEKLFLTH